MRKINDILTHYWGHTHFRPNQTEIINSALYGHDTLALLPTGGGKSICFQVPGIAREGLTLVVSPLIALMQDQVKVLQTKGLNARAIYSGMSFKEIDILLDHAVYGDIDFLYVSPERLKTKIFIERVKKMTLGLIVVDEAHCISEWGHDFRPSYMDIHELRTHHPICPIIAVTATATLNVQNDIIKYLKLNKPNLIAGSFERENLQYHFEKSTDKLADILRFISNRTGESGIVYCQTRKSVKEVTRVLLNNKIAVGIYHGGMSADDRKWMLNDWLEGKTKVMVSTNAFGMGIDKSDVRFVLHYELPGTIEAYYQEAGRAGRDGKTATATAFYTPKDLTRLNELYEAGYPDAQDLVLVYRALCNYLQIAIGSGKDETYPLDISVMCERFHLSPFAVFHCLKALQTNGNLLFNEGFFQSTKLKFAIGSEALYSFQIKNETVAPLVSLLSRSYPGIFQLFFEINEKEFTKRLGINSAELHRQLVFLEKMGAIDINWQTQLPSVTFLRERPESDRLFYSTDNYYKLKENAEFRLVNMLQLIENKGCRNEYILNYFGQNGKKCGVCDNCISNNDSRNYTQLGEELRNNLSEPKDFYALKSKMNISSEKLEELIQAELLKGNIVCNDDKFKIK